LSDDKKTAVFTIEDDAENYQAEIRDRLQSLEETFEAPQHSIQIKYDLTDGPIPSLSFDYEKLQLSCDWRKLLTIFYSEIELTSKANAGWVKSQEGRMQGLRAQIESGQLDMMSTLVRPDVLGAKSLKARYVESKLFSRHFLRDFRDLVSYACLENIYS
jgi:hypothetical protein